MALTNTEREKIHDSILKIQSVQAALEDVDKKKIPEYRELEECLDSGCKHLREALQ